MISKKVFELDIIIPVHSATRPIDRAVASVLEKTTANVLVTVVAHNIELKIIQNNLKHFQDDPRVQILHFVDGIASPAGPMNHGISHTASPYYGVMGSDDMLEPGAIDCWLQTAKNNDCDAVIPKMIVGGKPEPLPPARSGRTLNLDAVHDRLLYRCSPVGIISRQKFPDLRFTEGLKSGEDLAFTAEMWFLGKNIAYQRSGPGYLVNDDAQDRVTMATTTRSVAEDFAFLEAIIAQPWFLQLNKKQKLALGVKTLRLHLFDAIAARLDAIESDPTVAHALNQIITQIEYIAPGSITLLSRADRKTLIELQKQKPSKDALLQSLGARWGGGFQALLPANPLLALHPQAPYPTLRNMQV